MTTTRIKVIRCQVSTTSQFVPCNCALEPGTIAAHLKTHFRNSPSDFMTPAQLAQSSYIKMVEEDRS